MAQPPSRYSCQTRSINLQDPPKTTLPSIATPLIPIPFSPSTLPIYTSSLLSFELGIEVHDISILHHIHLALFLTILHQFVLIGRVGNQRVRMQHLRIDEPSREVRVDLPASLHCSLASPDGPGSDLIRAYCVEMRDL